VPPQQNPNFAHAVFSPFGLVMMMTAASSASAATCLLS
jgi:hypothetical protein